MHGLLTQHIDRLVRSLFPRMVLQVLLSTLS